MKRKHYGMKQAQELLDDVVRIAESTADEDYPGALARRKLTALAGAWFGDLVLDGESLGVIEGFADQDVRDEFSALRRLLRRHVHLGKRTPKGIAIMLAPLGVVVRTIPLRGEYFEVGRANAAGREGLHQLLALQVTLLVRLAGKGRIAQCVCDRVFVRVGKQKFCSKRCQKRDYMKRFRSGLAGKE